MKPLINSYTLELMISTNNLQGVQHADDFFVSKLKFHLEVENIHVWYTEDLSSIMKIKLLETILKSYLLKSFVHKISVE